MRRQNAKVRLGQIAGRQWGRVSWAQIKGLGVDNKVVADWKCQGYLHQVLPCVYAVGHHARRMRRTWLRRCCMPVRVRR